MKTKLKDYYKSILLEGKFDEASKMQFREDIKNFGQFGEHIYNSRGMNEVSEAVKNLAERASAMALDEAGDWFDAITVKKNMQEVKKDAVLFEKTAKEMGALQQRLEAVYEDMAHKLGRYYEVGDLAGKEVLPADNDYTANGEEEEEENGEEMTEQSLSDIENINWNKVDPATNDTIQASLFQNTPNIDMLQQIDPNRFQNMLDASNKIGQVDQETSDRNIARAVNQSQGMEENFSADTGKKSGMPVPGNQGVNAAASLPGVGSLAGAAAGAAGNQAANTAAGNVGQNVMPLGDLMSDDEIKNVKENYWTLQSAQKSLMEEDEGVSADEGAPGIAVNKSTEWKARNESRADFFTRMKEQLENLK